MVIYKDSKFGFVEFFNPQNGFMIRTNCDPSGQSPHQRSFPELLDIGIMGHCTSGQNGICKRAGIDCYQMGPLRNDLHMSFKDYSKIIKQSFHKVFQIALGGAGDPNKHPDFIKILEYTREHEIIPNLTTSGFSLKDSEVSVISECCGAVAVSFYSRLVNGIESNPETFHAIDKLLHNGCITNIHYVLSNDTIDEAIYRLENNLFPNNINAIIFLLYKPVGLGVRGKLLSMNNPSFPYFFKIIEAKKFPFEIGFDTCFFPILRNFLKGISSFSIGTCDSARFSMYIDSNLDAYPCSFDCSTKYYRDEIRTKTIQQVWNGKTFENFKKSFKVSCKECTYFNICNGGCNLIDLKLCK